MAMQSSLVANGARVDEDVRGGIGSRPSPFESVAVVSP